MKRLSKAAALTAVTGAVVLGAAGGAVAHGGASAKGDATGSPGVISGNNVKVPVYIPVNLCGNTVDVIGLANPANDAECVNK